MTDQDEPRVTWKPVWNRPWKPLPDSKMVHGPGAIYDPKKHTLTWEEKRVVKRRGFRDRRETVLVTIRKES